MLPKINRLRKTKDFEGVFKSKKGYFFSKEKILIKVKKNNLENSRFGFVVGRKVSKKATERNLIKRKLREAVRKNLPKIKKGIDVVIVVKPGFKENDFDRLIERIFKIAKIYDKKNNS